MKTRLMNFWETALDSFWFLPTLMTFASIGLFAFTSWIDRNHGEMFSAMVGNSWWLFDGGADGARTLLSTIAASIITVAGVVFSITIAAMTLASSQFGPRLLRNFTHDTGNQASLGVFVGTFLYCILVLRTVRSVEENVFVPNFSIIVGLGLGVLSLLVLIYFIDHIAETIQAPRIASSVGANLCAETQLIFPEHLGVNEGNRVLEDVPTSFPYTVVAPHSGYIQAIVPATLMDALQRGEAVARLEHRPGDWVVSGDVLLRFSSLDKKQKWRDDLSESFLIGKQRTRTQDIEYLQNQLVEMAARALSPAINDPFTAITCLDWIGAFLSGVVERGIPSPHRFDSQGHLRLITDTVTFDGLCDAAFHIIRQNANGIPAVLIHLLETLDIVARHTRNDEEGASHRATLLRHAQMVQRAERSLDEPNDRADLNERFAHFEGSLRQYEPQTLNRENA